MSAASPDRAAVIEALGSILSEDHSPDSDRELLVEFLAALRTDKEFLMARQEEAIRLAFIGKAAGIRAAMAIVAESGNLDSGEWSAVLDELAVKLVLANSDLKDKVKLHLHELDELRGELEKSPTARGGTE